MAVTIYIVNPKVGTIWTYLIFSAIISVVVCDTKNKGLYNLFVLCLFGSTVM